MTLGDIIAVPTGVIEIYEGEGPVMQGYYTALVSQISLKRCWGSLQEQGMRLRRSIVAKLNAMRMPAINRCERIDSIGNHR